MGHHLSVVTSESCLRQLDRLIPGTCHQFSKRIETVRQDTYGMSGRLPRVRTVAEFKNEAGIQLCLRKRAEAL